MTGDAMLSMISQSTRIAECGTRQERFRTRPRGQSVVSRGSHRLRPARLPLWNATAILARLEANQVSGADGGKFMPGLPRAVVLLSGGLDSATTLAEARSPGLS